MVRRAHALTLEWLESPKRTALMAGAALAFVASAMTHDARAQSRGEPGHPEDRAIASESAEHGKPEEKGKDEVLIGTFALKPKPGILPPEPAGTFSGEPAIPSAAADLYSDALRLLQSGDQTSGQRQLEQLVARYPSSSEARLARLRLARLYADPAAAHSGKEETSAAVAEPETAGDADGWSAEVRKRAAADEDHFRMEVGDRIFFVAGSAELGSRARAVLAAQAAWMRKQPQVDAVIEGHADDPGSADENRAVAQARAEAVRGRLIEEGIAPDRLRISALGRSRRIAECDGTECATHNRRAVTVVYPRGSEPPGARVGALGRDDGATQSADLPGARRARR